MVGPMNVASNLERVRERIAAACARVGRAASEVQIVAVTKTHPAETVTAAVAAGVEAIGENRVQEAATKRSLVPRTTPWHLVGPLQRNKAKLALELFDLIETVDRPELADRLETLLAPTGRMLPVFVEINVGGEAQKNGVAPASATALADHLLSRCPHLQLLGLMTVPPYDPDAERSRPHFAALRVLAASLALRTGSPTLELSMGMSEDFEVAVEEGASWVRLGRALFGERRQPA
jgi:pyridoxal phosphate enzyme (YggS family)